MRDAGWWNGFITGVCITLAGEIAIGIALLVNGYRWVFRCFGPNTGC